MTLNLKCLVRLRPYSEIAEDYWNREYLDYSAKLDNIVRIMI